MIVYVEKKVINTLVQINLVIVDDYKSTLMGPAKPPASSRVIAEDD